MGAVVKEYTVAMQKTAAKWLMVAGVTIGLTASGWAEEVDAGKAEYLSSCAPCHGADGKGKGPLSAKAEDEASRFDCLSQEEQRRVSSERCL